MKIIITGGGGFLGSQLAQKLLERGTWNGGAITEMVLLDAFFRSVPAVARVKQILGDISDRATVFAAAGAKFDLKRFNDAALDEGAVPVPLLHKLLPAQP